MALFGGERARREELSSLVFFQQQQKLGLYMKLDLVQWQKYSLRMYTTAKWTLCACQPEKKEESYILYVPRDDLNKEERREIKYRDYWFQTRRKVATGQGFPSFFCNEAAAQQKKEQYLEKRLEKLDVLCASLLGEAAAMAASTATKNGFTMESLYGMSQRVCTPKLALSLFLADISIFLCECPLKSDLFS